MRQAMGLAFVLMVGCFTGVAVRDLVVPARAQNQIGPNYEYSSMDLTNFTASDVQGTLARYGANGWHLSSTFAHGCCSVSLIFDRQVRGPMAPPAQ